MYTIIVKSFDFLKPHTLSELNQITNQKWEQIDEETYELQNIHTPDQLTQITYDLIYYSRTIDGIYLKPTPNQLLDKLEKFEIDYKNQELEVYDLIGDILIERKYKINEDDNYLSHFLINYCLYELQIQNEQKYSIIDPMSELGDIIIETSLFNPRKPLYVNEKNQLPIYKQFKIIPPIPKKQKDKNKYQALVLEDTQFKKLRENINESGQKIKISKYDIDWLDVKFKKNDFDYAITFLPDFDENEQQEKTQFLKKFFYQTEFICQKKICLISFDQIDQKYPKKYNLNLIKHNKIEIEQEKFQIYTYQLK